MKITDMGKNIRPAKGLQHIRKGHSDAWVLVPSQLWGKSMSSPIISKGCLCECFLGKRVAPSDLRTT